MQRGMNLDGVEISILKAIGIGSGETSGEALLGRLAELDFGEILDSIEGLISIGYVSSDRVSMRKKAEFEKALFSVNSGYARDLKEAIEPQKRVEPKSRRVRRE